MTPDVLRAELTFLFGTGSDRDLAVKAAPVLQINFRSILRYLDEERTIPGPVISSLSAHRRLMEAGL